MKQILFFLLIFLISCNQHRSEVISEKPKIETESKEFILQKKIKESVSRYIKIEAFADSSIYKSITWGILDSIQNPLSFKYKINHTYNALAKVYIKNSAIDSIMQYDMTFLLDSNFKITGVVETKRYADHFDDKGVSYKMFGGKYLEFIAIRNGFDMVFFENNKNRFLIIGGNYKINSTPLMSKDQWIQMNVQGASNQLLNETDTIEHCLNLSGDDCKYYIFKESKLIQEKHVL